MTNKFYLYPDPGKLPDKPEPKPGSKIKLKVSGFPPYKDIKFSIRNTKHRHYERFANLRSTAIINMKGRKWYDGPIEINLKVHAPDLEENKDHIDYTGGVMDTLDGSHGPSFTYLPIVYQDDCQVSIGRYTFIKSSKIFYTLEIVFLKT